jgi:hypothetical protein
MSEIDLLNDSKPEGDAAGTTSKRKGAKKAKPSKKSRANKAGSQPKADRTNKNAEVIAMMKMR